MFMYLVDQKFRKGSTWRWGLLTRYLHAASRYGFASSQHEGPRVIRFLTCQFEAPNRTVPGNKPHHLLTQPWKSQCHFLHSLLVKQWQGVLSQTPPLNERNVKEFWEYALISTNTGFLNIFSKTSKILRNFRYPHNINERKKNRK